MSATHKGPGDDRSGGATNAALGGAGAVPPPNPRTAGAAEGVGFVLGHATSSARCPPGWDPPSESGEIIGGRRVPCREFPASEAALTVGAIDRQRTSAPGTDNEFVVTVAIEVCTSHSRPEAAEHFGQERLDVPGR